MSSYELRLPPNLPSYPLADYCFALVALSFECFSKESSDYFSGLDHENCCLHTDSTVAAAKCTKLCIGPVLVSFVLIGIPLFGAIHCKFHIPLS